MVTDGPLKQYMDKKKCKIHALIGSYKAVNNVWIKFTPPHAVGDQPALGGKGLGIVPETDVLKFGQNLEDIEFMWVEGGGMQTHLCVKPN